MPATEVMAPLIIDMEAVALTLVDSLETPGVISGVYAEQFELGARWQLSCIYLSAEDGQWNGITFSYCFTYSLQLRTLRRHHGSWRRALVPEQAVQSHAHSRDIRIRDAEGRRRKTDLLNEPANLEGVEVHEFMHVVLAHFAGVAWEIVCADLGAAEQDAEVRVQVRQELAMTGNERTSSAIPLRLIHSEPLREGNKAHSLLVRIRPVRRHISH